MLLQGNSLPVLHRVEDLLVLIQIDPDEVAALGGRLTLLLHISIPLVV